MIPKILHLCWLSGDPYPSLIDKCVSSWRRVMPDFEIMMWTKETFDVNSVLWVKQAFEAKKYAFAADYIRFYALYNYGGIYLDSDVETLKPFDDFLHQREFLGADFSGDVEAAVMGAEKGCQWVRECLDYYVDRPFVKADGSFDLRPVPLIVDDVLLNYPEIKLLPMQYFSPKDYYLNRTFVTDSTYCIHHYTASWIKKGFTYKMKILIHRIMHYTLGRKFHNKILKRLRKATGRMK